MGARARAGRRGALAAGALVGKSLGPRLCLPAPRRPLDLADADARAREHAARARRGGRAPALAVIGTDDPLAPRELWPDLPPHAELLELEGADARARVGGPGRDRDGAAARRRGDAGVPGAGAVRHVDYDAGEFGVGTLVYDPEATWSGTSCPTTRVRSRDATSDPLARAARRLLPRRARRLRRRRARPRRPDAVRRGRSRARCARSRAARSSPTASWRRSRAGPARRGRPGTFCARNRFADPHPVPPRRLGGGPRRLRLARRRLQAPPARARACRCLEELRDELAAIAPRRRCDRLAELSALFHTAGTPAPARPRRGRRPPRPRSANAVARRAFSLLREFGVHAEIRTYRQHAFDRATRYQVHVAGDARALQTLHEAGVARPRRSARSSGRRRASSRARAAAARTCAARSSARGSLSGPRSPHLEMRTATREGAEFVAGLAAERGDRAARRRAARPRGRVREGRRHDRRPRRARGRERDRARARRARGRGRDALTREPARERRPREPRPRRTAAHRQLRAVRRLERTGRLDGSLAAAARDRRAAAPPPVALAARARAEVPPACDQGDRAPPAVEDPPPRGRGIPANGRFQLANKLARLAQLWSYLAVGGSALVRRWIQTPSVATVRSAATRRGRSSSELPLRPALSPPEVRCRSGGARRMGGAKGESRPRYGLRGRVFFGFPLGSRG